MSDLELQLREYLDASVERLTAEDVFARHALADRRQPEPPLRSRAPAWAAAYGFAMTLLVIGGSIALGLVLRREPGFSTGPGRISFGAGATTAEVYGWVAVAVAALLGFAALVLIGLALFTNRINRKEEAMATTVERPPVERELESVHRTNRWLITAVVVLAVALVALGAWVVYDLTAGSDTTSDLPAEVQSVLDDYDWSNYDTEAFLGSVHEPTYRFTYSNETSNAAEIVGDIEFWETVGLKTEFGDTAIVQNGNLYYVIQQVHMTSNIDPEGVDGVSFMRLTEFPDSGFKVTFHEYFGLVADY